MQLILISGITIAIGAVVFALQNNAPVVVTLALWTVEGSLALVLLVSLGIGALIAGLLSSPAAIQVAGAPIAARGTERCQPAPAASLGWPPGQVRQ